MTGGPYSVPRLLTVQDQLDEFDCGEPSLTDWLVSRAQANQSSGASRTYVTLDQEARVVGYYCLSSGAVQAERVPGKVRRNQPNPIPVVLLGRLAVATKEQGNGLGKHLLRDAILRAVQAADVIGVRALLVHALHKSAKDFYQRFDFEPSPTDELHLLLLIKDAKDLLGL